MPVRLDEILKKTTHFFKDQGISSARLDAELILAHALGWRRLDLYLKFDHPMNEDELDRSREMVRRRAKGEPVAYLLGHREFYKADFLVRSGVLVPRPETELIVELAAEEMKRDAGGAPRIWDFGVGSGCIGLSLLGESPAATLVGFDISEAALAVAAENAARLNLQERSSFVKLDVSEMGTPASRETGSEAWSGPGPDLIVGNPPYLAEEDPEIQASVIKFEPATALFSADGGLFHFKAWAKVAARFLRPGGFFAFEIGSKQGPAVREFLQTVPGLQNAQIKKDLAGLDRAVCGWRQDR